MQKKNQYIYEETFSPIVESQRREFIESLGVKASGGMIDGIYHINSVKLDEIDGQTKVVLRLGEFIPLGEKQVKVYRVMRPNELLTLSQAQALYNEN